MVQDSEHKYNLIVSGIDESPKGFLCHKCIINKTQLVATILHLLNPEINDQSMQKTIRIRKYQPEKCHPLILQCVYSSLQQTESILYTQCFNELLYTLKGLDYNA